MPRDIKKLLDEYTKKFPEQFYASDIDQLGAIALDYARSKEDVKDTMFYLVQFALQAGFMIGYEEAKSGS